LPFKRLTLSACPLNSLFVSVDQQGALDTPFPPRMQIALASASADMDDKVRRKKNLEGLH
jgi:hypothetical protein